VKTFLGLAVLVASEIGFANYNLEGQKKIRKLNLCYILAKPKIIFLSINV
jgi:hypothetical protein